MIVKTLLGFLIVVNDLDLYPLVHVLRHYHWLLVASWCDLAIARGIVSVSNFKPILFDRPPTSRVLCQIFLKVQTQANKGITSNCNCNWQTKQSSRKRIRTNDNSFHSLTLRAPRVRRVPWALVWFALERWNMTGKRGRQCFSIYGNCSWNTEWSCDNDQAIDCTK